MSNATFVAEMSELMARVTADAKGRTVAETALLLGENGLLGIVAPEPVGGLGLPLSLAAAAAECAGRALLAFPFVETLLAAQAIAPAREDVAAAIVAGKAVATLAWRGEAPELAGIPCADQAHWVIAQSAGDLALFDLQTAGVVVEPESTLDQQRGRFRATVGTPSATLSCPAIEAAGLTLRAAEMLGSATRCRDDAVAWVTVRRQFGRPLAAFQALRFELARHAMMLESLRLLVADAAAQDGRSGAPGAARLAYAAASETCPAVIEGAVQLHGGMGFTWDLALHHHLRRVRSTLASAGPASARAALAAALLEGNDDDITG